MARPQIIHSGHFMVSEPHAEPEPDPEAELSPAGREGPGPCATDQASPSALGPDFGAGGQGTCLVYRYGPRSSGALNIDASLSKLFECMTLAYSGKIVSPKWKTFKGLNLLQRDKIRLNNAIWRAWYLQYVEKQQNPVCGFVTPLECSDVDEHRKPEAVIMEGKYWKRQIGVVIREYHKWRTFFHTQVQKKLDKPICGPIQEVESVFPGVEMNSEMASGSPMDLDPLHDLEAFLDTIYSSRNPYGGPNLRGLGKAHQGNADMIQPTLTQLHPIFGEEFMDTLDPIHEFINSCHSQPAVQTGSEKNSLPTSGPSESTFAVPTSPPTAMGGRCRQLQRIAPAPSSSQQPSPPCTTFTHLLTTGPAPLPLTSVTNSAQDGGTQKLSTNVSLSADSAKEKPPLPPHAFPDTGDKTQERAEEKILCSPQEMYKRHSAKGSCRSSFTSSDCVRRMIISSGFNTLASLVLPGSDQTNAKLSKALLLQKSVTYVRRLQQERQQAQETVERLRSEIEELSTAIDEYQRQLPPNGAPVLPPQSDRASQLYEEYVHKRTLQDWRFWLFSVVIKPLFESYTRTVNTTSIKEFRQSVLSWLEQHCTLPILRPAISGSLLNLSKITSILTQPAQLPEQALRAVSCPPHCKGNS
ncbi:MLX-interacting protein isoform X3 [Anolis carolinensis]|uniref:MLX-interacting protein isoform X3 n=1 Tax=Anolis carolinensis TaxID=28377 RepID=UPI0004627E79|nr:PREDICTED: MLX-interacting protein isoform X3 [Anolis carolinensis]|eukprot:XP_008109534.1 PREDICTED: MLX-interacting protein isoform X3 [Anolis carolinensis]